jgi:hypothetical protein
MEDKRPAARPPFHEPADGHLCRNRGTTGQVLATPPVFSNVTGVLVRGGNGPRPLAGRWVVLHQVTMQAGGPVDSVRSDARGRWRLRAPQVDSLAVYVVSAVHDGLAYFSQPIVLVAGQATTADTLVVYDTTSRGPAVRLRRRLVTVAKPNPDGARDVLEILELENPGRITRVAADSQHPTWTGAIPPAALRFQVGSGDFSVDGRPTGRPRGRVRAGPTRWWAPALVRLRAATLGRLAHLPIDQPAELDLLIEDTVAVVSAPSLVAGGVEQIENRSFARYRAAPLAAGAPVTIAFSTTPFRPEKLLPVLIGAIVLALGAGLWIALKKSHQPSAVSGPS